MGTARNNTRICNEGEKRTGERPSYKLENSQFTSQSPSQTPSSSSSSSPNSSGLVLNRSGLGGLSGLGNLGSVDGLGSDNDNGLIPLGITPPPTYMLAQRQTPTASSFEDTDGLMIVE